MDGRELQEKVGDNMTKPLALVILLVFLLGSVSNAESFIVEPEYGLVIEPMAVDPSATWVEVPDGAGVAEMGYSQISLGVPIETATEYVIWALIRKPSGANRNAVRLDVVTENADGTCEQISQFVDTATYDQWTWTKAPQTVTLSGDKRSWMVVGRDDNSLTGTQVDQVWLTTDLTSSPPATPQMMMSAAGESGTADPWLQEGLSPYGTFFGSASESVPPATGRLILRTEDLYLPGRGIDFSLARVYSASFGYEETQLPEPYLISGNWRLDLPYLKDAGGHVKELVWWGQGRYKVNEIREERPGGYRMRYYRPVVGHFDLVRSHRVLFDLFFFKIYDNPVDTLTMPDGKTFKFYGAMAGHSRLTGITDLNGNSLTVRYAKIPHAWNIFDTEQVTEIEDSIGRVISFENFDDLTTRVFVNDVDGTSRTLVTYNRNQNDYRSDTRLANVVDTKGRVTSYVYGTEGRITDIVYPTGGKSRFVYEGNGRVQTWTRDKASGLPARHESYVYEEYSGSGGLVKQTTREVRETATSPVLLTEEYLFENTEFSLLSQAVSQSVNDTAGAPSPSYRKTVFGYNSVKEKTREDVYLNPTSTSAQYYRQWQYDEWGNVVLLKNELGHESYFSFQRDGNGKGSWPGSVTGTDDWYINSALPSTVHDHLLGIKTNNEAKEVAAYTLYDNRGNVVETKVRLEVDGQTRWPKTRYDYTTLTTPAITYGPTSITEAYHDLTLARTKGISYERFAYPQTISFTAEKALDPKTHVITANASIAHTTNYDLRFGKPREAIDPYQNKTEYLYDSLGRLTRVTFPAATGETSRTAMEAVFDDANRTVLVYSGSVNTDGTIMGKKLIRKTAFDGLGRKETVQVYLSEDDYSNGNASLITAFKYCALGLTREVKTTFMDTGLGRTRWYAVTYEYDGLGRMAKETRTSSESPKQSEIRTAYVDAYDADGNGVFDKDVDGTLKRVTDAKGKWEYLYDWAGRLRWVKEYKDKNLIVFAQTRYTYDDLGNLTAVTDARSRVTSYVYDNLSRLTKTSYPVNNLGRLTEKAVTYDDLGRTVETKGPDGKRTVYRYYGGTDWVKRIIHPEAQTSIVDEGLDLSTQARHPAFECDYDARGNRLVSRDNFKWNGASYSSTTSARTKLDERQRPLETVRSVAGRSFTTAYHQYDPVLNLVKVATGPGGSVDYDYDDLGQTRQVSALGMAATTSFYPVGVPKSLTLTQSPSLPARVQVEYGLDTESPVLGSIRATQDAAELFKEVYQFDEVGNLQYINLINTQYDSYFDYDGLGRLTAATIR